MNKGATIESLNRWFDNIGVSDVLKAGVITRGEQRGKYALVRFRKNEKPEPIFISKSLDSCRDFARNTLHLFDWIDAGEITDTRAANMWLKQFGMDKIMKFSSEVSGNRRIYSLENLDPRMGKRLLCKGNLKQCINFVITQTGIGGRNYMTANKQNIMQVQRQGVQVRKIQSIDDANRWLQSIGAGGRFRFGIDPRSREKGGTIYTVDDYKNPDGGGWNRSLYLMVYMVAKQLRKPMPPCKDDRGEKISSVTSANRWLQKIDPYKDRFFCWYMKKGEKVFCLMDVGKSKNDGQIYFDSFPSLREAIGYYCDNYGEPMPYMDFMDR